MHYKLVRLSALNIPPMEEDMDSEEALVIKPRPLCGMGVTSDTGNKRKREKDSDMLHLITTYQSANKSSSRFCAANNFEAGVTPHV